MRRTSVALLALVLVAPSTPLAAEEPAPEAESPLWAFHVGGLTQGRIHFLPSKIGTFGRMDRGDAEQALLFGEVEEPIQPAGSSDEIVWRLARVLESELWPDTAWIKTNGGRLILLRHSAAAARQAAAELERIEQRWMRPLAVDLVALRLPPDAPAAPTPEMITGWVGGADAGPGLTLAGHPGQRVTGFAGRQQSYLLDYETQVAAKASVSDPMMGVLTTGISAECRMAPSDDVRTVRVSLTVQLGLLRSFEAIPAGEGRRVESPILDLTTARVSADLEQGVWTLLDGSGPRAAGRACAFAVRVRVGARPPAGATAGHALPEVAGVATGPLVHRVIDITRLVKADPSWLPPDLDLLPSDHTPPEPPELPESRPAISQEALSLLLRGSVAPESWGGPDDAWVEANHDDLVVRAPATAISGIERMLAALERALLYRIESDVEVLDVPAELDLAAATLLETDTTRALAHALASGAAKRIERVRVSSQGGARNYAWTGDERTIVADYDIEVGEGVTIAEPVVVPLRTGLVVDVQAGRSATGDAAVHSVRFTRSEQVALRSAASAAGEIQCPEVRMLKLRLDLEVPFGRTGVVGAALENGRRTVVLLTPRLVTAK
jgi:hypothetical protein